VGPRAGLGAMEKKKIPSPCREPNCYRHCHPPTDRIKFPSLRIEASLSVVVLWDCMGYGDNLAEDIKFYVT